MRKEFEKVLSQGKLVKANVFVTDVGTYVIEIYKLNGQLYFIKYKNGNIVECMNLSKG